jgi:hypothetical protein
MPTPEKMYEAALAKLAEVDEAIEATKGDLRRLDGLAELSPRDLLATENAKRKIKALAVLRGEAVEKVNAAVEEIDRATQEAALLTLRDREEALQAAEAAATAAITSADKTTRAALDACRAAFAAVNAARAAAGQMSTPLVGLASLAVGLRSPDVWLTVGRHLEKSLPDPDAARQYAMALARAASDTARLEKASRASAAGGGWGEGERQTISHPPA